MIKYKPPHSRTSCHSFLNELYLLLKRSGITPVPQIITDEYKRKENPTNLISDGEPTLGRIDFYMEEHLSDPLTLEELAQQIQVDKYQLIRRFKNEKNTTPWQYLIAKRIEMARQLLENGMPVAQVAQETGFYDQSHLNRVFKKELGITPNKYQEKNFKNKN